MKKILVYSWGGFTDSQLYKALDKLQIEYICYAKKLKDYHKDLVAAQEIIDLIHQNKLEAIFSYNYIPLLSMVAELNRLPYLSWIYDCPHYTVLSETIINESNYLFCFDKAFKEELVKKGAKHVFHFPLGVDVEDMEERIACAEEQGRKQYQSDVTFIGSFYNNQQNRLRYGSFSEYTRGYLSGIIEAQGRIYGGNFVLEVLPETILEELIEVCELKLAEGYYYDKKDLAAGMINKEITARERERALAAVAEKYWLHVYTGSEIPDLVLKQPGFVYKGFADPLTQMPAVFHQSKINLNITLKSITSGIPQRVLDILACGGFCLTNYQPEIAAYFEDGKELVMYSSLSELCEKVEYYLGHEEERQEIADRGKEKVKQIFDLELRLKELLKLVE